MNVDKLPLSMVAKTETGKFLGIASLVENDMDVNHEFFPWISGVLVVSENRKEGIGSALVRKMESWAFGLGFEKLYLFTFDKEPFYLSLGWSVVKKDYYLNSEVTVMQREISKLNKELLYHTFMNCWSIKSSSLWTSQNPARGQCSNTALVIQDYFGGEILKTVVDNQIHFYNMINNQRIDITASQFANEINYEDNPSNRLEAFADTNEIQYNYLSNIFIDKIKNLSLFSSIDLELKNG
jgi:N-acetylglutamate synthase-like GNAT family acetyltransferase